MEIRLDKVCLDICIPHLVAATGLDYTGVSNTIPRANNTTHRKHLGILHYPIISRNPVPSSIANDGAGNIQDVQQAIDAEAVYISYIS